MSKPISAARVVRTSFLVDISDVILNLILAFLSGSAVMVVQTLQGAADLITSWLLLVGVKRSKRASDKTHQFGYGREIYFWTLMSGIMMITVTATVSFYHGWQHYFYPQTLSHTVPALIVLAIGLVTNFYALSLSYQRLRKHGSGESFWELFRSSVLVETKAAFVLDLMGTASAVFGLLALGLYAATGDTRFDGMGAMVIGVAIALLAILLIIDVKDILVGRSVSPELEDEIRKTACAIKGVEKVLDLRTMYLGSERLLVNLELHIAKGLKTEQIERLVDIIKAEVKAKVPSIHHIQVELETPRD